MADKIVADKVATGTLIPREKLPDVIADGSIREVKGYREAAIALVNGMLANGDIRHSELTGWEQAADNHVESLVDDGTLTRNTAV